jgi:hypothetical protein
VQRFKIIGIDPDIDTCDCCGRSGLKRTIILGCLDADGNVLHAVYYGTHCASTAMRFQGSGKRLETIAEQAQRDKETAERNQIHHVSDNGLPGFVWVVESIGSNGGSIERLCLADGLKSEVYMWAASKYPYKSINVRKAI